MAKTVQYDPRVIEAKATALYVQADSVVLRMTIWGGVVGGILGGFLMAFLSHPLNLAPFDALLIGLFFGCPLGGLSGRGAGQRKAFDLYLQAQTALCQVRIENNTRHAPQSEEAAHG